MADRPVVDLELDVTGVPNGTGGTVRFELVASASAELAGVRLSIDKLRAPFALRPRRRERAGPPPVPAALADAAAGHGRRARAARASRAAATSRTIGTGEWRGALTAQLGPVSVSGFGVLGTEPFSLLVVLAAEFTPAIQLSFGFTLVGVGGLVGINRRPRHRRALGRGQLRRPVEAAVPERSHRAGRPSPRDVERLLPAQPGSFVVGPMLKLGWGTPTLVAATIGVLVSDIGRGDPRTHRDHAAVRGARDHPARSPRARRHRRQRVGDRREPRQLEHRRHPGGGRHPAARTRRTERAVRALGRRLPSRVRAARRHGGHAPHRRHDLARPDPDRAPRGVPRGDHGVGAVRRARRAASPASTGSASRGTSTSTRCSSSIRSAS